MPTTDSADVDAANVPLDQIPEATLKTLAEGGHEAAAAELDRRGIEPEMVELGPTPIRSFDIAQEHEINPAWLREYAGNLKHEATLLEGHVVTLSEQILAAPAGNAIADLRVQRLRAIEAGILLHATHRSLMVLASSVEHTRAVLRAQAN